MNQCIIASTRKKKRQQQQHILLRNVLLSLFCVNFIYFKLQTSFNYFCFLCTGNSPCKNQRRKGEPEERFRYVYPERIELSFERGKQKQGSYQREGMMNQIRNCILETMTYIRGRIPESTLSNDSLGLVRFSSWDNNYQSRRPPKFRLSQFSPTHNMCQVF